VKHNNIINPVIVTALYDIGRDNWEHYTQSYWGYMDWMEKTLSLDAKIVIYTEEKFAPHISERRKKFDPNMEKTIIVVQPLESLVAYELYNFKLEKLMFSDDFKKKVSFQVPEMTKPLYNVIMFNKAYWLKHCVDNRFFDNDMVIWADAGGLREELHNYQGRVWPNLDKVNQLNNDRITFFSHTPTIEIWTKEEHSLSQSRKIQGTAFLAPSHTVNQLCFDTNQTIIESINEGYIGSDEKIFDITYIKNPSKYELIVCTWREYYGILS